MSAHVRAAFDKSKTLNALWKYFGVAQTGVFKPEEASVGEKIDFLIREVTTLKSAQQAQSEALSISLLSEVGSEKNILARYLAEADIGRKQREKLELEQKQKINEVIAMLLQEKRTEKKKTQVGG